MKDQQVLDIAMAHHRADRLAEAEVLYRQLLAAHPGAPDLLHLLGMIAGQAGRAEAAVDLIRQAIAANPSAAAYHSNLAIWLVALGRLDDAASAHETAIRLAPDFIEARFNLGFVRMKQQRWEDAAECYRAAIALRPDFPDAHLKLGTALANQGRLDDAIAAYRVALAHLPRHGGIWNDLGNALRERDDLDGAVEAFRAGLACEPGDAVLANNLGNALKDQGLLDEAIECFRRSLALDATRSEVHSNLIFAMHFHPGCGPEIIAEEQRRWCRQHSEPLAACREPHANERSPERKLRVGYVSPDFREHPIGRLLRPVFEEHDGERFEIVCYSDCGASDAMTARLRSHAALWRDTAAMSDAQLAAQVRADGIDILVDLALHTAGNRLPVFARKPAPVQVSWLGYAGGAGLDAIDFRLTDSFIDPPGGKTGAIRLPDCWCCYRPDASPAPPVATEGGVTFGSLNGFAKVNDRVLGWWARILRAVESSRLLLIAPQGRARERVRDFFEQRGVAPGRIEFLARGPQDEYFRQYRRIDLALDAFPYNGMTTTCDALWMGVPVVTLAGIAPVSRTALSLLATVGLGELAAASEDEYVRIAAELALDRPRLAALRAGLRGRMEASPLMDAPRFTRNLEAAFRTMWRRWCASAVA